MPKSHYQKRIARVLDYITDHHHQNCSIETLSSVACLSPYHWHRIYMSITGETIYRTLRRTRLAHASKLLIRSQRSLYRIGKGAHYRHIDSFSRAFKQAYGNTPSQFRIQFNDLHNKVSQSFDPSLYRVIFKEHPALTLSSIRATGDFSSIPKHMNEIFASLYAQQLINPDTRFFTLYETDAHQWPVQRLRWRPGIFTTHTMELNHETIVPYTIPGGLFLSITHQGPYETLEQAFQWIYQYIVRHPCIRLAHFPSIEEYLNDPKQVQPKDLLTSISLLLDTSSSPVVKVSKPISFYQAYAEM